MKLTCQGVEIDQGAESFGALAESNDLLGDIGAMKRRMDAEGYLFFRSLIPREEVLAARREIMLKYAIIGEIDAVNHDVMDAIQSEVSFIREVNLLAFTESIRTGAAYSRVVMHPNLLSFYEGFLGGAVRSFDFRWPRFVRPGEGTGLHADIVYIGRGTQNLWSSWIPIGDVHREEGSLLILEQSHLAPKLKAYWSKDADRDHIGWFAASPLAAQKSLGGRWLTADFKAGDVICFDIKLIHASLDNNSPLGRCRLTSDTRYLLEGDALDDRWNGDIRNPHGGSQKAFLPGLNLGSGNKEFEEEWKPVDEFGRLKLDRSQRTAAE